MEQMEGELKKILDEIDDENIRIRFRTRICKYCGKKVIKPTFEGWAYKIYKPSKKAEHRSMYIFFCSWHCIQQYRRKRKARIEAARIAKEKESTENTTK